MSEKKGDWHEVDAALRDGSLYTADMETLHRYLRIVTDPPPSNNEAFYARLYQAGETIRHLISQKENETQQKSNEAQLWISIHWGRVAAWAAIIGAVAAIVGVGLMVAQLLSSSGR